MSVKLTQTDIRNCPLCGAQMTLTLRVTRSTFRCPEAADFGHWVARRARRLAAQTTTAQGIPSWEHYGSCGYCGAAGGDPCIDLYHDIQDLPHDGRLTVGRLTALAAKEEIS